MFKRLEKFLADRMAAKQIPGYSVAVVKGSEVVYSKGFGYANREKEIPVTTDTVFRVASVSKPVVATGLLQWMEKGRFTLDDPVNQVLEDIKIETSFKEQPTIRNLLSHSSGLPVHIDPVCFSEEELAPLKELIRDSARTYLPPNREIMYSNTAFNIAGYLVGEFAGEPYPRYMKSRVFEPLEMNLSGFEQTKELKERMVQPYIRRTADGPTEVDRHWLGATIPEKPCGSLCSTATDLGHFLIAQMNGGVYKGNRILDPETVREMHRLQAPAGASRNGYAISWKRTWHHGRLMLSHTGGKLSSHVAFYPEHKLGIVLLSNVNDMYGWRPPAWEALHLLADGPTVFDPTKLPPVSQLEAERLTGTYSKGFSSIDVHPRGCLMSMTRGGVMYTLEKLDGITYMVHGGGIDGIELTFELDEKGYAKQIDLDTQAYPRCKEEKHTVDRDAELVGVWQGEYLHHQGFFDMRLRIESPTKATAMDMQGRQVPVNGFTAGNGKVTGRYGFDNLPRYVGWGGARFDVELDLEAVDGKLMGLMVFDSAVGSAKVKLVLSKV